MSSSRPGISLLEVVVGMTIIGMAVTSGLAVSSAELRGAARIVATAEINALAELKLNEAVLELNHWAPPSGEAALFERFDAPMDDYEWRVTVRVSPSGNAVVVDATVRSSIAERTLQSVAPWPFSRQP